MFKFGKLIALAIASFYLSGCASIMTAEQAAPAVNTPNELESVSIAVVDKREYVLSGDKSPNFEGLSRSNFGIPYSQYTYTGQPMSEYLTERLVAGFMKKGVDAEAYPTSYSMSLSSIKNALAKKEQPSIIIALNEWKYDYHAFSDNSWYDVDVVVLDKNGEEKIKRSFKGENDVGSGLISNEMQTIYKQRFESIFLDDAIQKALVQ
ncbi:hypothetical protein CWC33_10445 [Idiomarina sp. X4]|uniref:hypothetical protein n=1 Tax=Idiomarina sp. X4 TaxID=2055892 RepID=UPI000C28DA66|nr:hypothetical protein [Idiomarina sp. X4]ATZ74081.1 hypothetical protein CWC33_10445 [Idiomarina sp. X4]